MVFVVNSELKMGVGKVAAQVAHAALGLHRTLLDDPKRGVGVQILAYKPRSWVFILHRKKCYTHNYIKHHLPRQIIPDIRRYRA